MNHTKPIHDVHNRCQGNWGQTLHQDQGDTAIVKSQSGASPTEQCWTPAADSREVGGTYRSHIVVPITEALRSPLETALKRVLSFTLLATTA